MNELEFINRVTLSQFDEYDSNDFYWTSRNHSLDHNITEINGLDNVTVFIEKEPVNNWWALIALVLVVCTAAGNVLVCLAIYLERRLQNVTNYFLMSLAITDLLVAILVMPLGILTLVRGKLCVLLIFNTLFVFFFTLSFNLEDKTYLFYNHIKSIGYYFLKSCFF
ncbi:5-hydroxytryptamine receptor 2A [Papilio xuthus]|uniref:5-hydroxytryptamine receptor 2A n=1 Tax=Papilio xuthus TaxID=66420 RepID=A0A194PLH1_PAPXU|nr:5-hydroxytryptamine receptor 2A [Papilio xuthus]